MIAGVCGLEGRSGHRAGRELLAELYRRETGEPLPPILIRPGGKPSFQNSPWHFSISHTSRHAFCVLARERVGLDAEELDRRIAPGLAKKILSPEELRRYAQAEDKPRALITFWVLKEASAKLTGEGIRRYPNHTDFSLTDSRLFEAEGCVAALFSQSGRLLLPEELHVI